MPSTTPLIKLRSRNKSSAGAGRIREGSSLASKPPSKPSSLGSRGSGTSFPESSIVRVTERDFLQRHTPQAVLDMIKDGSYDARLGAFLDIGDPPSPGGVAVLRTMFGKRLSQSDVGQRKGLVVPKKDAEAYFPDVRGCEEETLVLRFLERRTGRWLDLRYCFYRSSQSYVLTTGWCKFVKANCLKERDVVKFYECAKNNRDGEYKERYVMIDIVSCDGEKVVQPNEDSRRESKRSGRAREELMVVRRTKRCKSTDGVGVVDVERGGTIEIVDDDDNDDTNYVNRGGVKLFGAIIG